MLCSHPRSSPGSHVPYVVYVNMTATKSFIFECSHDTGWICYDDMT